MSGRALAAGSWRCIPAASALPLTSGYYFPGSASSKTVAAGKLAAISPPRERNRLLLDLPLG